MRVSSHRVEAGGLPLRGRLLAVLGVFVLVTTTMFPAPAAAHDSENDGHIPANVNYGFEVIGRDVLEGITDGKYTDVWSHDGFAYIGTFQEPECTTAGVFVVDIAMAIENYPETSGATVAEIPSAVDTRINDVKTVEIGDTDVLIATEEPCGAFDPETGVQAGNGGVSLWDVTDPLNPTALAENFSDFGGVHNTYPWTSADGNTYMIGVADTFDGVDVPLYNISDPANPELILVTGATDWLEAGVLNEDQLGAGNFDFLLAHDVWVENIDGSDIAVVPYWDAGFVTLDVTDPANPVFLADSTYPETDPAGHAYEGNAHAAVFGMGGDIIVAGDEDFDPARFGMVVDGEFYLTSPAAFPANPEVPLDINTLAGKEIVWTGGVGCLPEDVPPADADSEQIALIQRGVCAFATKAFNAQEAGYVGYVVANDEERGDALLAMGAGADGDLVTIPGTFVGYSTGEIFKTEDGSTSIDSFTSEFDGWGYLRVLNHTNAPLDVPDQSMGPDPKVSIPHMGEIGYYAPAEALEGELGGEDFTEFGDLTMHNLEQDPTTIDVTPTFDGGPRFFVSWYSLGMRAIEYRPGHFHANLREEGSYSWNVHEVGRYIADDGSNFWGVHVDNVTINDQSQQIILASDRNTGLWIFTFGCENRDQVEGPFYCENVSAPEPTFECSADMGVLSWTDDVQDRYWIYKSTDGGETYNWIGRTSGETTFTDPMPMVGARYQVHYDGIARTDCTIEAEPPPFSCSVDAGFLTWTDAEVDKYWFYRSTDGGDTYDFAGRTFGSTSKQDPSPAVGALYQVHYAGIAKVDCAVVAEPSASLLLNCTVAGATLSWADAEQSKYWVYRSTNGGATYNWIGRTLSDTTFTDPSPVDGALYQVHYAGIPRRDCVPAG